MDVKNRIYLFVALTLGFGALYWEIRQTSGAAFYQELSQLHLGWLGVAFLCMLVHWGIEGKILQGLLKRQQGHFSFRSAVRIPLIEHVFNAITPFSTGGQPAQLITLARSGVDPGVAGSVCLMKFVTYQIMIVLNFIACLLFGYRWVANEVTSLSYLVLLGFLINLVVVIGLLLLMYCYPLTNRLVQLAINLAGKFTSPAKKQHLANLTEEKMLNFYYESQYMRRQKKLMARTFSLTFLQLVCYYTVPYFILKSLGLTQLNMMQIIVLHAFIILVISLFPVPGGAGGAEYRFSLLFGTFMGTKTSQLVVAIVLWRLVTHYFGIFLGLIASFMKPLPEGSQEIKETYGAKQVSGKGITLK